eukprot:9502563-Pyramimonas_sp.AAC.3
MTNSDSEWTEYIAVDDDALLYVADSLQSEGVVTTKLLKANKHMFKLRSIVGEWQCSQVYSLVTMR